MEAEYVRIRQSLEVVVVVDSTQVESEEWAMADALITAAHNLGQQMGFSVEENPLFSSAPA